LVFCFWMVDFLGKGEMGLLLQTVFSFIS
jgi:hypothetical protein